LAGVGHGDVSYPKTGSVAVVGDRGGLLHGLAGG